MSAGFGTPYTADEDQLLSTAYVSGGIAAARAALPTRSEASLYHRAERLGLQRRRRWTAADDDLLRRLWTGDESLEQVARTLRRTACTTYWRAQKLGLPLGLAPGWEYLWHAAERTGFCTSQLRRILKRAGVEIRPSLARPSVRRGRKVGRRQRFWMVWPADIDAAVEDWLQRETVEQMAKRLGVARATLQRRLEALGGKRPAGKRHWRITDAEAKRAVQAVLVRTRRAGRYSGASYTEARA